MDREMMRKAFWLAFVVGMTAGLWGGEPPKRISAAFAAMFAGIAGITAWRRQQKEPAIERYFGRGSI